MRVRVSAPGKTILMGEHAAVYGRPALVAAVARRVDARLRQTGGDSVRLELPEVEVSETVPWGLVGASLTSLTLFAVLAAWASARIFRATVLLYGVRPSLGQLIAAIRSPR